MDSLAKLIHLLYYLIVPIYIREASHTLYMLYIAFQRNLIMFKYYGGAALMYVETCAYMLINFYEL
jgi:hypothetical protein